MTDKEFWGEERHYYEFSVRRQGEMRAEGAIRTVRMDHLPGEEPFPMYSDRKIITWAEDSESVTFRFQGVELTLHVGEENGKTARTATAPEDGARGVGETVR
jgi:hypothetical protein